jgi:DNA-binding NarL/FixJ family response regulator
MFRRTVARVLRACNEGYQIREAQNGKELLCYVREDIPDIIILDLEMPIMNGFKVCEHVVKEFPEVKIIILSMYDSEEESNRAMHLGAHAFLSKNAEPELLEQTILNLTSDKRSALERCTNGMESNSHEQAGAEMVKPKMKIELSPREYAIVDLLCKEFTNKQIGYHLGLSLNTIRNHKVRIMHKAGVKSTPGLVRMAYEDRFVLDDPNAQLRPPHVGRFR